MDATTCPACGSPMDERDDGYDGTEFLCPACGHVVDAREGRE